MQKNVLSFFVLLILLALTFSNFEHIYPISRQSNRMIPRFNINTTFDGDFEGWGIIKSWYNKTHHNISLELKGNMDDVGGTIDIKINFGDSGIYKSRWLLTKSDQDSFILSMNNGNDKIYGKQYASMAYFCHKNKILNGNRLISIKEEYYLHLINHDSIIIKAKIKRYGFAINSMIFALKRV